MARGGVCPITEAVLLSAVLVLEARSMADCGVLPGDFVKEVMASFQPAMAFLFLPAY